MMAVSAVEKIFFVENLSMMLRSGVPIIEALETLEKEARSKAFRKVLSNVKKEVSAGKSLAESLKKHPKVFDKFFCDVVKIGEKTGALSENLNFLFLNLQREENLKSQIRGALVYPALILFVAFGIILIIIFYLLPKIIPLFHLMGFEIPSPAKILISIPPFLKENWLKILLFIFLIFIFFKLLRKIKKTRYYLDKIFLSLPFFGSLSKNLNLSILSRSLYILLKSGLSLRESLEICSETIPSEVYKKCLIFVKSGVERGEKIGESFKNFPKVFPYIFSQMILVAERSGTLDEVLFYQSKFYEEKLTSNLKKISRIIEPALIIFVGLLVALIAISIISTIYRFISQFRPR